MVSSLPLSALDTLYSLNLKCLLALFAVTQLIILLVPGTNEVQECGAIHVHIMHHDIITKGKGLYNQY